MHAPIDSGKFITMFADASYDHKTKICGWACWIKHGNPAETIRLSGTELNVVSSTEAELLALMKGVERIVQLGHQDKCVVIQSDCTGALTKLHKINPIKQARYKHVKGHQGFSSARSSVNTWCDEESRRCMRSARDLAV